jgi:hypothetical protein
VVFTCLNNLLCVREEVARVQSRDVELQALLKSIEKQKEDNRYHTPFIIGVVCE